MSKVISWNLKLQIADGKMDELVALANEMSKATRVDEPGALSYEWFVTDDGTQCNINERYVDNNAVLTHLGNFESKFIGRFMEILTPVSLDVFGPASDALRERLAAFGATHLQYFSGFAR